MKKLILSGVIAVLLFQLLQSCKKANKITQVYTMTAMVGNNSFNATGASSVTATPFNWGNGEPGLQIHGQQDPTHVVSVSLVNYTGQPGTFIINETNSAGMVQTYSGGGFKASYGHVDVTSVTQTEIVGDFTFKGDDSSLVSGQFIACPQ